MKKLSEMLTSASHIFICELLTNQMQEPREKALLLKIRDLVRRATSEQWIGELDPLTIFWVSSCSLPLGGKSARVSLSANPRSFGRVSGKYPDIAQLLDEPELWDLERIFAELEQRFAPFLGRGSATIADLTAGGAPGEIPVVELVIPAANSVPFGIGQPPRF